MRYVVVEEPSSEKLEAAVEKLLQAGYKCQGGIFILYMGDGYLYFQAMAHEA